MSKKPQSPAIIIKRKHQSAPKAHPADKEIRKAAQEIDGGRWVEPSGDEAKLDNLGVALGLGTDGIAQGRKQSFDSFRQAAITTRDLNQLGRHPRVIEALEKMKLEVEEATNPQEAIEKAWMLHEMTAANVEGNKWEGQERWQGKDNEAMRLGQLLTPQDFYAKLCKVIGRQRILLSTHAVKTSPAAKSGRVGLYIPNPLWAGENPLKDYPQQKAQELRKAGEKEYAKAKKLRAAGANAEADKAFTLAGDMAQTATEILMEMSAAEQTAEPQFLRVGTLQWPLGTEWMVMNFDEYGVPTTAKYLGWRTALLTMVRCGVLTEEEAHKAFPVGTGPAANWYLEQLFMRRNGGKAVN